MCANCGFPEAPGHWTEAGAEITADRMRARYKRATLLRAILRPAGLTAHEDGATPGITISTLTGNQEIVPDLAAVWAVVERLTGKPIDPLSPEYLCAPVTRHGIGH